MLVDVGNAYVSGYADVITDTCDSDSSLYMVNYPVPFYQMVFQDNTVVTAAPINTTVDYDLAALKCLENGTSLKYNLFYANVASLVGTEYNTMVSYSYEYWKDIIVEQYRMLQSTTQQFAGQTITAHKNLANDVYVTEYETGKIVINYSDESYIYNNGYNSITIQPRTYLVLSGGKK